MGMLLDSDDHLFPTFGSATFAKEYNLQAGWIMKYHYRDAAGYLSRCSSTLSVYRATLTGENGGVP
jgi:hypothetical protein